jgi:hypothetical protein
MLLWWSISFDVQVHAAAVQVFKSCCAGVLTHLRMCPNASNQIKYPVNVGLVF